MNDGNFGLYYRATIDRTRCWYFVAILRSFEHMVFDRTYDVQNSVFEFFVPELMEPYFLQLMAIFKAEGVVLDLNKMENRLAVENIVWTDAPAL